MRKINKILDIDDQPVRYINDSPVSIEICNIHHTPVHIHKSAVELIYCLEGQISIHCNHEFITLSKGQIFTVDFEDVHCLYSDVDNLLIIMHIDLKKLDKPWSFMQYVYLACEDNSCAPYQKEYLQEIKEYGPRIGIPLHQKRYTYRPRELFGLQQDRKHPSGSFRLVQLHKCLSQ